MRWLLRVCGSQFIQDEVPSTTADQDAWTELAQAIRVHLRKYAEQMPAMRPEELKTFVETVQAAYWLEVNAAIFDKKIKLEHARVSAD